MNATRINVKAMEPESSNPNGGGGETSQTETIHNLYYDSDDDLEETDLDDRTADVVVPIDRDEDFEDPKADNLVDNKQLFVNLPSFADTARSLHAANSVKKTIRRRLSKRQLTRNVNETSATDGNDDTANIQRQKDLEEGEMEIIRSLGAPMGQRKSIRKLNIEQRQADKLKHKLPCWKLFKLRIAMSWKLFKDKFAEFMVSLQLWRAPMKEVEGNFGNGVLSYFLFLRSLFFLNLIIFLIELMLVVPQALINYDLLKDLQPLVNVSDAIPHPDYITNRSESLIALDFFTGQGFINTTIMFYSNYHGRIVIGEDKLVYNMPLAYIMVGGAYMIASFLVMVRNFSERFTESIMESTDAFQSYCNKVFASWDYCITNDKASVLKKNVIYQDFIADLEEEKRLESIQKRTRIDKFKIYMIRIALNLFVLALLALSVWAIYETVQLSTKEVNIKVAQDQNKFVGMLQRWSSSLTISALNLFLPTLFELLTNFEEYSPHLTLVVSLFRSVLLKLASIIVLMVTLYEKFSKHNCNQCWENQIAAQMFNLILVDFFVICAVTIFVETTRKYASIYLKCGSFNLGDKIGRPEFQIPKNILDLVYGQSLIWLGTFFAPLLPVLGILKLFIIFYVKKISLMFNCKSSSKSFQGARSNYFITLLLLLTFLLCTVAIGYGVAQMKTSRCGPYSNTYCNSEKFMVSIIMETIDKWPTVIAKIISFIKTAVFIIPVLIITFLLLYYYHAMTTAHEKMIELLQGQLKIEGRDKRFLMNRLVEINNNMNMKGGN